MANKSLYTLMFHGVVDTLGEYCLFKDSRNCFVRTVDFEKIIDYCSRRYKMLKPEGLDAYFDGTATDDGVFITVDDALQNFFDNGIPILQKYKTPATIFISSDWTNQQKEPAIFSLEYHLFHQLPAKLEIVRGDFLFAKLVNTKKEIPVALAQIWNGLFAKRISANSIQENEIIINNQSMDCLSDKQNPGYWKPASWETINKACQQGTIQIGGHGKTHTPWPWLSTVELEKEFIENKEQINQHLNVSTAVCTFPHGMYDGKAIGLVKKHYRYGFTNRVQVNLMTQSCLLRYNVPFQRPNNISSLISYPIVGKFLRKAGSITKLY